MRAIGKGLVIGFAITIAVLLVSGWLSYRNLRRISTNEALVVHTHEVLDEVSDLLASLAEAETQQRSYLITGDPLYLKPYRAALAATQVHVERLRVLTEDNSGQQRALASLRPNIRLRIESLETAVGLRDTEGLEAARRYVAIGKGRREMDLIRERLGEIKTNRTRSAGDARKPIARQLPRRRGDTMDGDPPRAWAWWQPALPSPRAKWIRVSAARKS